MGSGFIAYAIMMTLILLVGEQWIRRIGKSPEFFDSWVITIWVRGSHIALRQEKLHKKLTCHSAPGSWYVHVVSRSRLYTD